MSHLQDALDALATARAYSEQADADVYNSRSTGGYRNYTPGTDRLRKRQGVARQAVQEGERYLVENVVLPEGTVVSFTTKDGGWNGGYSTDTGTIVKYTDSSIIVRKTNGGTARLDRQYAAETGGSYGHGRSLRFVRSVEEDRALRAQRIERQREQALLVAQQEAVLAEQRRLREGLAAQHALMGVARQRAMQTLLRKHAAEFDTLVGLALDVLSADAEVPGREALAPLVKDSSKI